MMPSSPKLEIALWPDRVHVTHADLDLVVVGDKAQRLYQALAKHALEWIAKDAEPVWVQHSGFDYDALLTQIRTKPSSAGNSSAPWYATGSPIPSADVLTFPKLELIVPEEQPA